MFGPFVVKNVCKELKWYGALYTCLSSRVIHIEMTYLLNTDLFIMCLKRFISQKRNVRLIRSNNGLNFTGASAELIQAFQEMNHSGISNYLEEHGGEWINWKRNPPFAGNIGRVWEWQIQSAIMVLSSLLKTHGRSLTDESLQTQLVEVDAVANSRPLKQIINGMTSWIPLRLINLLTMKSKIVMPPPGGFASPDR